MTATILLTGANGRTGRAVLKSLVASNFDVKVFVRNPAYEEDLRALGAAACALGDLSDTRSLHRAVEGCAKFLHIGPPMHADEFLITQALIDAAQAAGAGHFIYYSVMHPLSREIRHHRLKLDAEEYLIRSGMAHTILQPSRYMQHLELIWPTVMRDGVHAMPFSTEQKFSVVDLQDLADACAVVAADDRYEFGTYELAGPEALSQNDMASILSEVTGRQVKARAVSFDEMREAARKKGLSEDRIEQMEIMNRHYDAHGFRSNPQALQMIIGRPANSFRNYVKRLTTQFSGRER